MRTGSVAYADQKLQEQAERAAAQAAKKAAGGDQPLLLYFYDGLEILIRPLADLNGAIIANKHFKWSESGTIEAICAKEIDKPCALCERAKEDKSLTVRESWFIPVYMYQAVKTKDKNSVPLASPEIVSYKENDVVKTAKGVRVLEMKDFGAEAIILKTFRKFMADPDNGKMTDRDFKISQDGKGKGQKAFIVDKKDPRPRPDVLAKTPPLERVWERILEKLPPQVVPTTPAGGTGADASTTTSSSSDDLGELDDYEF